MRLKYRAINADAAFVEPPEGTVSGEELLAYVIAVVGLDCLGPALALMESAEVADVHRAAFSRLPPHRISAVKSSLSAQIDELICTRPADRNNVTTRTADWRI